MPDIFLSYNREDQAAARRFAEAFGGAGLDVWWDTTLRAGEAYDQVTEKALREAKAVIVLWSKKSVESRWVRAEATMAERNKTLVPAMIEPCERPIMFELTQTADLSHWQGEPTDGMWLAFLADVKRFVEKGQRAAPSAPGPAPSPSTAAKLSICVLPFANMSRDEDQEYFADGISEDIITDLSKVSALSVTSRNTAFSFKGKHIELKQVAHQLGVSHVLEGSVRKAGNRLRITAQLIDGASDDHVWAERYDRDLDDIFALQDEIAQAIVAALKIKLAPEEKKAIERRGTDSVEAYDLYLMARQEYLNGFIGLRPAEALIRMCQRAVEIDPNYAQPWALMAMGRAYRRIIGEAGAGGLEEAERALSLNDKLAEAHAAKAWVLALDGRLEEASAEVALALRLDPESHEVNAAAAVTLFRQQKFEEAAVHWERAAQLIDQDTTSPTLLITCYKALGRERDMRRVAESQLARVEKILAHDRNDSRVLGKGCLALAALGQEDRAREWMNRALLIDPDNLNMRYNFACTLAKFLNAGEAALDMLAPVLRGAGPGLIGHAKVDPDFDGVRELPRFKAMMDEAEARLAAGPVAGQAAPG